MKPTQAAIDPGPRRVGREGGCLQGWLGIADASEVATCRFLRHEWALRDMMAAMPTLGGGPA